MCKRILKDAILHYTDLGAYKEALAWQQEILSIDDKKCTDALLSRWVDLLNDERDQGLTAGQEQQAYAALRDFIRGLPCEN